MFSENCTQDYRAFTFREFKIAIFTCWPPRTEVRDDEAKKKAIKPHDRLVPVS